MNVVRKIAVATIATMTLVSACKTSEFTGEARKAADLPPLESKTFQQVTGEPRAANVTQGVKGASANEAYNVTATGILDLLIVVDNSGSMSEEQANLSQRLVPLMSAVKDSDWQIAVTTTDPSDRCVTSLIQKNDLFAETRFKMAVSAGTRGTGIERPILRAVEGLKSECFFGPGKWVRPNSTLAILIVSDEDNCHIDVQEGYGCVGQADLDGAYLTNYLSTIRKIGTEARVYGLFWHPTQSQSQCSTALKSANIIANVVAATQGTWGSICDADYSATLTKISTDVAKILKADFTLKSLPDSGSLKIIVNGVSWTAFTQTGTAVHFTSNPPAGASIAVSYVSGAAGLVTNEFALPSTPVAGSLSATIGGKSAGTVTWDDAKKKAVFSTLPPEGSSIDITYKDVPALKDTFEIAKNADPTFIKVVVNGAEVPASGYTYEAATGAIKFKTAPADSAKIDISWRGNKQST